MEESRRSRTIAARTGRSLAGAAIVFVGALTVSDARADWQYTHWGMSKDQVMLASNGALSPVPTRRATYPYIGLRGKYVAGEHTFDAAMLFDAADALSGVLLSQRTGRECARTLNDLRENYGAAQELSAAREPLKLMWNDAKTGNRIKYDETPRLDAPGAGDARDIACVLTYESVSQKASGL